jgi:dynein heavy chain
VTTEFRRPLDKYFKEVVQGSVEGLAKLKHKISPSIFDKGIIYDYCYQPELDQWKYWTDFTNKDELDKFPKGSIPQEIVVTTADKIKYCHILELNILAGIPTLFCGPTGTGKTKYIQSVIFDKLPKDQWLIIEVGFSA